MASKTESALRDLQESALRDLQAMILWCRKNGVAWQSLSCGAMTILGGDMRGDGDGDGEPSKRPMPVDKATSMYHRYGGALLEAAADSNGMTSVVEEDTD